MAFAAVLLSKIILLLVGLSVQSKSDSIRNGIIMNGANETENSANTALADGSIDKNAVQQQSVEDYNDDDDNDNVIQHFPINSSIPQQQIDSNQSHEFDFYLQVFLAHHPGAEVVQPENHIDNHNYEFRFSYPEVKTVEVVIHSLDINPFANWLLINSSSINGIKLINNIEPPNVKRILFKNTQEIVILFNFTSSEWSRYHGFVLTIQPLEIIRHDGVDDNDTMPENFNGSNSNSLEILKLLIEVPKANQINETWHLFRVWFANSTNKFINATGIKAEKCSVDNVTLNNIYPCKTAWPNSQNCVETDFSLELKSLPETSTSDSQTQQNNSTKLFQFSRDDLIHIWLRYGREEFKINGFKEFPVPEAGKLLFLWSTVSLCVIGVFLLILAGIWKMEILRDYRRMYWKNNDDEKQICKPSDMTMYPPAHQIVPTLFPNDLNNLNNSASNTLPFEYMNRPITFNVSDFNRRLSLEESLKPNDILQRKAGEVPFQCDSEFNETKQDRPEDEIYFNNSSSTSPRLAH